MARVLLDEQPDDLSTDALAVVRIGDLQKLDLQSLVAESRCPDVRAATEVVVEFDACDLGDIMQNLHVVRVVV